LLQTVQRSKFCIAKTLGLHLQLVLNNSDICAFTSSKEIGDISDGGIEGEVAEMDSVGGLVR